MNNFKDFPPSRFFAKDFTEHIGHFSLTKIQAEAYGWEASE